ncbi:MAG: tetratricopeptide repeat protein, partial [Anaerolineaceae bacterium]|nr:tetratricopeptide repeat protein [Anaerolineaceae bacterium]
ECIQEHFIIILDDYHYIDDQAEINQFLGSLIQATDENCHLVISSRTLLSLPDLPLMVARSQVGGLGFDELAFQPAEIQALIQQNYKEEIHDSLANELAQESEGWITGLLLSTQSRWQGMTDRLRTARVSAVGLYDYLAQQVLDQQTPAVRDFLLRTAPLEEFDAGLCEAVFGPPHYPGGETWQQLMEATLHNNLFLLPVGENGSWLRYHHLFRDFLQSKLAHEQPTEEQRITHRLAQVLTQRGNWDAAYNLFTRLGDTPGLVALIEEAGSSLIKTGRLKTLALWIDALPAPALSDNPLILSLRGSVAVMTGEIERGLAFLNHSVAALRKSGDMKELARTLPRRAHALQYLGKYPEALADAEEAIHICADLPDLLSIKAAALRSKGLNLYRLGKWQAAIASLIESAHIVDTLGVMEELALVNLDLGMIYQVSGAYTLSRAAYESARASFIKIGDLPRQATVLNNLGVLFHVQGSYDLAATLLEQALSAAEQSGFAHMEANTLTSIGDLYRDLDAPEAAENAYARAHEIAQRNDDRFLLLYLTLVSVPLAFQLGNPKRSMDALDQAIRLADDSHSAFEQAAARLEGGRLALLTGDAPQSIPYLRKATEIFESGKHLIEATRSHFYMAAAYAAIQQPADALAHLAQAFSLASSLESQQILVTSARDVKGFLEGFANQPVIGLEIRNLLDQVERFENELPVLRKRLRRKASGVPFALPRLMVRALGRPQVFLNGKQVTDLGWNSQAARDLFFLLLANPEGMKREAIGALLWPESSGEQLKLQFKNAIYRLRRSLEQDVVLLVNDYYRFNTNLDYDYDVETFKHRLAQAGAETDARKQIQILKSAVQLYKEGYLFDVDAAWTWPQRSELHQDYLRAALKLGGLYFSQAEFDQSLEVVQKLLHREACLEEAHRLAMRVHAAMGNKIAVVRQYERCQNDLLREINT